MKAAGVATGMPIWDALVKCPGGVYLKRDFRWYEVLSRLMLEVVREWSPQVEYYSIDEFFFRAMPGPGQTHQRLAESIRDAIRERLGVPVTVGIARTRTLAKLISDAAKPEGALAVVEREAEEELLADRPVTEMSGIAGRRAARLSPWGIDTCLDLARADRRLVRSLLTAAGEALWWELNGEAVQPIHTSRPAHKALARGGSFGESTAAPVVLYAWLVRNLERLVEELEYHGVATGRLSVWLAYKDGRAGAGHVTLPVPSDRFDVLLDVARPSLRRAWIPRVPATHMHLIAEHLTALRDCPLSLFDPPEQRDRAEAIARVKREVNARHGRFVLRSAATLPLVNIYRDSANEYDICDVGGNSAYEMCVGIALAWSEVPTELIGRHGLERRVHERGGEREIHFLYRDRRPRLPISRDGRLQVVRWGNGRGQSGVWQRFVTNWATGPRSAPPRW
jgi:nucleotidyltransferase/DNA polymerase involved in DNA repair